MVRSASNILMEMRKVFQHPYISKPEAEPFDLSPEETHKELVNASGKLLFLKQLLPRLKARGRRVLLFSQFKIALDRIEDFLIGEGYKYLRLDGDVAQVNRQRDMDKFNAPDSDYFIFLLTTRAGGVGVNLASADTVIMHDPDFNPHADHQAISRSHRYGQTKPVLVFKLMMENTPEVRMYNHGKRKLVLDHLVVQQMGKEVEEGTYENLLLWGAEDIAKLDEEDSSSRIWTPDMVDELIDTAEKEAKELGEQQAAERAAAEASTTTSNAKGAPFSFAKIWEREKKRLEKAGDVVAVEEEVDVDIDKSRWTAFLQKEMEEDGRRREEEAREGRRMRKRKRVSYAAPGPPSKRQELEAATDATDTDFAPPPNANSDSESEIDATVDGAPQFYEDLSYEQQSIVGGLVAGKQKLSKTERYLLQKKQRQGQPQAQQAAANTDQRSELPTHRDPNLPQGAGWRDLLNHPPPPHQGTNDVVLANLPPGLVARIQAPQLSEQWSAIIQNNPQLRAIREQALAARAAHAAQAILVAANGRVAPAVPVQAPHFRPPLSHQAQYLSQQATQHIVRPAGGPAMNGSISSSLAFPTAPSAGRISQQHVAVPGPQSTEPLMGWMPSVRPAMHQAAAVPRTVVSINGSAPHNQRYLSSTTPQQAPPAPKSPQASSSSGLTSTRPAPQAPRRRTPPANAGPTTPTRAATRASSQTIPLSERITPIKINEAILSAPNSVQMNSSSFEAPPLAPDPPAPTDTSRKDSCYWCQGDHPLRECDQLVPEEDIGQLEKEILEADEDESDKEKGLEALNMMRAAHAENRAIAKSRAANCAGTDAQAAVPRPATIVASTSTSVPATTAPRSADAVNTAIAPAAPPADSGTAQTTPNQLTIFGSGDIGSTVNDAAAATPVLPCVFCGSTQSHSDCPRTTDDIKRMMATLEPKSSRYITLQYMRRGMLSQNSPYACCPFCDELCGNTIRQCVEANGTRKDLKQKIRQVDDQYVFNGKLIKDLEASPDRQKQAEGLKFYQKAIDDRLNQLYACYHAWPNPKTQR